MATLFPFCRAVLIVLVAGTISACSSTHNYTSNTPENLTLIPDVRSGSARLHVYDIDNMCNLTYQGTVELSDAKVKIGLPVNKPSYLVFNFSNPSLFTGGHSTSYEMFLAPRAGYYYDAAVNYIDGMYGAVIHEQNPSGGTWHEVQRIVPKTCASKHM